MIKTRTWCITLFLIVLIAICVTFHVSSRQIAFSSLTSSIVQNNYSTINELLGSQSRSERVTAVTALLSVNSDESNRRLSAIAKDGDAVLRIVIADRLPKLPQKRALPLLRILILDQTQLIQNDAVMYLEKLTGKSYRLQFDDTVEKRNATLHGCLIDIDTLIEARK